MSPQLPERSFFFAPRLSERKARRDGTGKLEIGKKLQAGGRRLTGEHAARPDPAMTAAVGTSAVELGNFFLLAIETAGSACSAALLRCGALLAAERDGVPYY